VESFGEMRNSFLLFLFVGFLLMNLNINLCYGLGINEINYNPINQTYKDEYIEIYGYSGFNISDFIVCDGNESKIGKCNSIRLYKFVNSSFALITVEGSNYADVNASVYFVNGSRIGGGLNNDGDCVYFYAPNFTFLVDFVCYKGNGKKGNSFQFFGGSWQECPITPGYGNFCEGQQEQERVEQQEQSQQKFSVFYPSNVLNNGKEFVVLIDTEDSGLYDVKIDVTANGERLSEIWDENEGKWKSTYYYVTGLTLNNKTFVLRIKSNYSGEANMDVKIRNGTKTDSFSFSIKIHNYFLPQEQEKTEEENQTQISQTQKQECQQQIQCNCSETQVTQKEATQQIQQTTQQTQQLQQLQTQQTEIQQSQASLQQPQQYQQATSEMNAKQQVKPTQEVLAISKDHIFVELFPIILSLIAVTAAVIFFITFKKLVLSMIYG
jgi:hypothetical protein